MNLLAPLFLWIGLAAAGLVVAIHFFVTRLPRVDILPTARFVPDSPAEAVSRSARPSDLLLLLFRVLIVLLVALAFARPVISPTRQPELRIILADVSGSSRSLSEVRDSVVRLFQQDDMLIAFDSTVRSVSSPDSILSFKSQSGVGNLSAAFVAALRAGRVLREHADSISLVIVAPLGQESWDSATDTLRSLWPGSVRLVRTHHRRDSLVAVVGPLAIPFDSNDPLRFAVALAAKQPHERDVSVNRGPISISDERPGSAGSVQIHWPIVDRPRFSVAAKSVVHTSVVGGSVAVIAPFESRWGFPADSLRGAHVLARWVDGSPAAVQRQINGSCIRSVAIPVIAKGDLVLRAEFIRIVQLLISPCVASRAYESLSDGRIAQLRGGSAAASRSAFQPVDTQDSPFARWLLLAALVLMLAEQFARRSRRKRIGLGERLIVRRAA